MQRILRHEAMEYEFNHNHEPKLKVKQGEKFVVATLFKHSDNSIQVNRCGYTLDKHPPILSFDYSIRFFYSNN